MAVRFPSVDDKGAFIGATRTWVDSQKWLKAPLGSGASINALTDSGLYPVQSTATATSLGLPAPGMGFLEVMAGNTSYARQKWIPLGGGAHWARDLSQGVWKPWDPAAPTTDSGWRDITATIYPAPTTGRVLIRRSNKHVELTLDGVTWDNNTGTVTRTNLIPPGFQPDAPITHGTTSPHPGSSRAYTITSAGAGTFHSLTGGDVLNTTTGFTTAQPWPSTLPGAAA